MAPPTDTSEKGLESLIFASLVSEAGYARGDPTDYDREHAVDLAQLAAFLAATQPETAERLALGSDSPTRRQFLARVQGEIASRGVVDVLRKGLSHGPLRLELFYGTPTPGNTRAQTLHAGNIFSITRQLRYSRAGDGSQLALDLAIFINGLPIATFELKNSLTKQTVHDAMEQYRRDRDPREPLFALGRCAVHFAVDDQEVRMCTHLTGKSSWFLPFNKGHDDGAGNPPNPRGLMTDYLWREVLAKASLTDILENYAALIEEKDERGRRRRTQIFPRYHQLGCVRAALADAAARGPGRRYLVQHSAGSGKSNSITWLAHQLVELSGPAHGGEAGKPVFDSIIVVTDRTVLDDQIRANIRRFAQVSVVVGAVTQGSGQLREFIRQGKRIIISTIQKFPYIVDEIGDEHRGRAFAIIIDEAHSSQGSRISAKMHMALSSGGGDGGGDESERGTDAETDEEKINRIIESRKMLPNASYFAFTATPKNKTLEMFGEGQPDETFKPFHEYTMKQAIQEGFILDVLAHYTPAESYYRLAKRVEDDPEFDVKRAQKKLRRYVESHDYAIRVKTEIMVDHFEEWGGIHRRIGNRARAMVVTSGIQRAIQYKTAFDAYLREKGSPFRALVAFSGEHELAGGSGGEKLTEASMNGLASSKIAATFRTDPYRYLIVADKFQTGYDEPLLHTMYVDKQLSDIKAVQTLSRLNRAHPQKHDTFVLDFMNGADVIREAFQKYYRGTILSEATDPNKLHDLKASLDGAQVYGWAAVEEFVRLYLSGVARDRLDPLLDACVAVYMADLDEDGQVRFKGDAKAFVRTYSFLATVIPWSSPNWERLATFLNFLIPKLPSPKEEDLAHGILEAIDMDSYRAEVKEKLEIALADQPGEVGPVPTSGGGRKPEPELDRLSMILKTFNEMFGNIEWKDADKIRKVITEEIPAKVAADEAYQNARKHSDKQNAKIEHDKALTRAVHDLVTDHTELFKQFVDNESFRRWLTDTVFRVTYDQPAA